MNREGKREEGRGKRGRRKREKRRGGMRCVGGVESEEKKGWYGEGGFAGEDRCTWGAGCPRPFRAGL